jgi:NAD-dependent deacetylase
VDGDFNYIEIFYKYWFPLLFPMIYCEPNINHYFLLRLEAWGLLSGIITQNTDGLHKKAGSSQVFEIHGNVGRGRCTECAKNYPIEFVVGEIETLNIPPACKDCGGIVGPDIMFAFERTPDYDKGLKCAMESEVLLVMGSSLLVDHVKEVVLGCIEGGGRLIIINSQPTPFDEAAEKGGGIVIRERLSSVVIPLWDTLSRYF